jgi:hypothetical protein
MSAHFAAPLGSAAWEKNKETHAVSRSSHLRRQGLNNRMKCGSILVLSHGEANYLANFRISRCRK